MWTRPDTGDAPVSYPAPTYGAAQGIFEAVLWLQNAEVEPTKVEICAPLIYHQYTTNYGGPMRKADQFKKGNNYQLIATVLINVCYRLYAQVRDHAPQEMELSVKARRWRDCNGAHAYQDIFQGRLEKGRFFRTPCLGWQEFLPDYLGPFREETQIQEDLTFVLPSMLCEVFPGPKRAPRAPRFSQNVQIKRGVLNYAT